MGNIRLIGFSDCSCRLTSIMYCNWEGGGLSSRVLEPCALLSEACAVPFWLLGASCLGVRWGGLREGDLVTGTEELQGCQILGLCRKGEACRVIWETSLGLQIWDDAFCEVQVCASSHHYHLVTS